MDGSPPKEVPYLIVSYYIYTDIRRIYSNQSHFIARVTIPTGSIHSSNGVHQLPDDGDWKPGVFT